MKPKLPQSTRAEKVALARDLYRQHQLSRPKIRMARAKRRVVVAGLALVVALTVAGQVAVGLRILPEGKALGILWALLGVQAIFFVVLLYAVGNLTQLDPVLDERERAQRDHAMASAYRILMVVVALVALGVSITATVGRLPAPTDQVGVQAYVAQLLWFVVSLPLAVMAWTLPDPEPDPEPEA
jgi:hypothetical protein